MEWSKELFTDMQIDAIGEILNISMGSAATAVSNLLDKKVVITTPTVEVLKSKDFHFERLEPAIGIEINYVEGLVGTNVMILKKSDIKAIVGLLLQIDFEQQEFILDEMSISAICEVMNQMMGASSTALSQFLNRYINISTPMSYAIDNSETFKHKYYEDETPLVSVTFNLNIDGLVDSNFVSVMSVELAKELISVFQTEPEPAPAPIKAEMPAPAAVQPSAPEMPTVQSTPAYAPAAQPAPQPQPKQSAPQVNYQVQPVELQRYDDLGSVLTEDQSTNLNLIMAVPLQITVEIGRARKQIKDILEMTNGSIIELNKQAGAQVDIFANGQPIAKGDVVVVEDMYGVRITEIINNNEIMKVL